MDKTKYFFAVDLGATSGRTIIGSLSDGKIVLEELTRFGNNLIETGGHVYWDIYALYSEIINGLKIVAKRGIDIVSIGIDTWGCDFLCVGRDGAILRNPLAYRDPHTVGVMERYFDEAVDKQTVYGKTGIQFMNFNSLFQLYAMRKAGNSALENAEKILFIPDALSYMLTGKAICEYTVASTSQLLNPVTKDLDADLLNSLGIGRDKFGEMTMPGTVIGELTEEVQRITGLKAVPAHDERFAYLSSGTWSLMGIETRNAIINARSSELNFTNEGGIDGTTRFLKNICGMWIYERCRKEFTDAPQSHAELQREAMEQPPFRCLVNPDDPAFANPSSMITAIQDYCRATGQYVPQGYAEIIRCVFDSLALRYRQVFTWLKEFADFSIDTLYIIGGGSLNSYLNQMTANSCGVNVKAGPQEATAIGNIMLQAKAAGEVSDIWDMRSIITKSIEQLTFEPQDKALWDEAYEKFLKVTKK